MKIRHVLVISLFLLLISLIGISLTAQASPPSQVPQAVTPTPDANGHILYTVKEGDNCTSIELRFGISDQQLRALNNLDTDCTVIIGTQLLLGVVQPPSETPVSGPTPTPGALTVTPTSPAGTTEICVLLFNDVNGDAEQQTTELGIAGGAVSVTNINGSYSQTQDTIAQVDPDTGQPVPVCFTDVPEGDYNVSIAIPDGYNPTMEVSSKLQVQAGDTAIVDFGAQSKTSAVGGPEAPSGGSSPLLGILGALFLLGGAGLGWYAMRIRKPAGKGKLSLSSLRKRK
jgi:hypothetical protein